MNSMPSPRPLMNGWECNLHPATTTTLTRWNFLTLTELSTPWWRLTIKTPTLRAKLLVAWKSTVYMQAMVLWWLIILGKLITATLVVSSKFKVHFSTINSWLMMLKLEMMIKKCSLLRPLATQSLYGIISQSKSNPLLVWRLVMKNSLSQIAQSGSQTAHFRSQATALIGRMVLLRSPPWLMVEAEPKLLSVSTADNLLAHLS